MNHVTYVASSYRVITLMTVLLLLVIGGCSSNSPSETMQNGDTSSQLQGTVIDERSGQAIQGASISTDPPTEEVVTDINGNFTIRLNSALTDPIRVVVNHFAYLDQQTEVTPLPSDVVQVSFALQSSAIGLHAAASSVFFSPGSERQSLRLSSNVQNTGFSIIPVDPWISVIPSMGVIANRETVVLQIMVDPDRLPALPAQSEVVINSDNGTRELVITLIFQDNGGQASGTLTHDRQNDCRQEDVLRFGYDDQSLALVQFLESAVLPADEGPRRIDTIGNPFLVDSIVVEEIGFVSIEHISGGPEDTSLELFDVDKSDTIRTLAVNTGASETNRRAAIVNWSLTPGVYCYYLGGTQENFQEPFDLDLRISFTPVQ